MRLTTDADQLTFPATRQPARAAAVIGGLLLLTFVVDSRTGTAPFQHLYYLPIILAGIRFTTPGGVAAAFAAVVLYHIANPQLMSLHYGEPDAIQMALFF